MTTFTDYAHIAPYTDIYRDLGEDILPTREVTIPAMDQHNGIYAVRVTLAWYCPKCGAPRGEVRPALSYDGSRRLGCDGWRNPCGHVDKYHAARKEARTNGLNR